MQKLKKKFYQNSGIAQLVERSTWCESIRDRSPVRENKKYTIFYWEYFWAISTQVRIEHDLPLPMILMGEPLANYVKSLDCRCELASETRTKTGNELLLRIKYRHHIFKLNSIEISNFNLFIFRLCEWTTTKNIYSNSFVFVRVSVKLVFFEKYSKNKYTQLFPKIFFPEKLKKACK